MLTWIAFDLGCSIQHQAVRIFRVTQQKIKEEIWNLSIWEELQHEHPKCTKRAHNANKADGAIDCTKVNKCTKAIKDMCEIEHIALRKDGIRR